jgi:hypothetical protein
MIGTPASLQRALAAAALLPPDHTLAVVGTVDESGAEVVVVLKRNPHWALETGVHVTPARKVSWQAGVMFSI